MHVKLLRVGSTQIFESFPKIAFSQVDELFRNISKRFVLNKPFGKVFFTIVIYGAIVQTDFL